MFATGAWKLLPMPADFYKKYNLQQPEPLTFQEFLPIATRAIATTEMGELRPIAEGGVRPMPERPKEELPVISSNELSG